MAGGYELTPDDVDAFGSLVSIAGAFGANHVTAASLQNAMAHLYAFTAGDWTLVRDPIRIVVRSRPAIANPRVQAQHDLLLESLVNVPTVFGGPFPALFGVWLYLEYVDRTGAHSDPYIFKLMWRRPLVPLAGPAGWLDALDKGLDTPLRQEYWQRAVAKYPSEQGGAYLRPGFFRARILYFFEPEMWTDAGAVKNYLSRFWSAQARDLDGLKGLSAFDADAVLFLLHLLAGLCNSVSAEDRHRAATILTAGTASPEYPNDTMASQLVYAAMLALADPRGKYRWTNAQLRSRLAQLAPAVSNSDPGSVALAQALTEQERIAHVDDAYPMQDPYVPAAGFTERYANALAAIGQAWSTAP